MKRINRSLIYLAGVLMLVLTLLANLQVFSRFLIQLPLPWVEEVIRYIMIYLVLIMSSTAIYLNSHLYVDILDLVIKGRYLQFLTKFRAALVLIFTVSYAYLSFNLIINTIERGQVTPALQISMVWPLLALLLGGILMAMNCINLIFPSKIKINNSGKEG